MIISHKNNNDVQINDIKARILKIKNPILPHDVELKLVEELTQFPLGQFLLSNKGLNGFWTAYAILQGPQKQNLHPLENWLLNYAPCFKATRQRFYIFQKQLQKLLKNNTQLASIPCGLMDDLLTLNYSSYHGCHLTGIDLDPQSIELATQNAKEKNNNHSSFINKDAWHLNFSAKFDVITSNGLNIYEKDNHKLIKLYQQFHNALKDTGHLLTSFITPPFFEDRSPRWKIKEPCDALKEGAIFIDILQAGWQCHRTEEETRAQLQEAGFKIKQIIYDEQTIFPTVIAVK